MGAKELDLCQWFTPPAVAFPFLDWCRIKDSDIVLDPAAGEGALTPRRPGVIAVELDPTLLPDLRYWRPDAQVILGDFLTLEPQKVDLAVLNPPYSAGNEGIFIRQTLKWAQRCCALIRTVALHGKKRFENCWRFVQPTKIVILTQRPKFVGPKNVPTKFNPEADYAAIECVLRNETLPLDAYSSWVSATTIGWVNRRS